MIRALVALALLAIAAPSHARIIGRVADCYTPGCTAVARLQLEPDADASSSPHALFIGLFQLVNGSPNPSVSGWFNGHDWQMGLPVAAWAGLLAPRPATIRIPGGVCGLVRRQGGPSGSYGLFAGWGRNDLADSTSDGVDEAAVQRSIDQADPVMAAKLRGLLAEYHAAVARRQQNTGTDASAFTDMRAQQTYWLIASFQCDGRVN